MSMNIYKQARINYNDKVKLLENGDKLSQEIVSELANVGLSTIKRIEAGESQPSPETLIQLSEIYNDSKLLRTHCSEQCVIGSYLNRNVEYKFQPTSLFEAGYGLINANKQLDSFKNELFDILSDGIVTDDEVVRLQDIMINLDKVQEIVTVIKDMINEQVDIH